MDAACCGIPHRTSAHGPGEGVVRSITYNLCKLLRWQVFSLVVVTLSLVEKQGLLKCTARCTSPPPGRTWRHSFGGPSMVWLWHCYLLQSLLIVTAWFQAFLCVTNDVLCSSSSCNHKLMFCHTKVVPPAGGPITVPVVHKNCPPGLDKF